MRVVPRGALGHHRRAVRGFRLCCVLGVLCLLCLLCAFCGLRGTDAAGATAVGSLFPGAATPWAAVALLAVLHALCGSLTRQPLPGPPAEPAGGLHAIGGAGTPVLLAGAFLLPPAAAALVPVAGALADPGPPARRLGRAARLSLATWTAAHVHASATGLVTGAAPGGAGWPQALAPALAAALAHGLVLGLLDVGLFAAAGRTPPCAGWRGAARALAAPLPLTGVYGLGAATAEALWHSPYGPGTAVLALLPACASGWALARHHRERAAQRAAVGALVQAVGLKDGYTRGHSERVGDASVLIGRELGLTGDRLEALRRAGTLHDVGKLGVPTRLLRKDGPLTPEERRVVELHPEYGDAMVRGIGFLEETRAAILHHHERLDGGGYPSGLSGDKIPEVARVIAVADAFDAMTSTRSYRRARPVPEAVAELRRCCGSQFDPRMVRALSRALERHGWRPGPPGEAPVVPGGHAGDQERGGNVPPAAPGTPPARVPSARPTGPHAAAPHASLPGATSVPTPTPGPPPASVPATGAEPQAPEPQAPEPRAPGPDAPGPDAPAHGVPSPGTPSPGRAGPDDAAPPGAGHPARGPRGGDGR
ncbi:HD domain-containing protein [Streptomyces sp. PLAI1-29]|uniref:HD domain-containing protein n=1 Tax=Streptomyces zingiberis TaxID=2053010 RepID=A0ABX1BT75_9ACTN|nr:HD domain-containing protein [Streptomyces zingiberis]